MGRYGNFSVQGGFRGKSPKMRKRLGWGWCEVPASMPLTEAEMVHANLSPRKRRKGFKINQTGYKSNGISRFYNRTDKNMWPYSKGLSSIKE
jgi:hypothetical protein